MDSAPNKSVRAGLPSGARLLHLYAPGERMPNGKRSSGKEPNEQRGHHDAVPQSQFLDIGSNVGIALDGQFIVVDFDVADGYACERENLPETWMQQTLRGTHLLYAVPPDWFDPKRTHNVKYTAVVGERQRVLGDIKCAGYIVAPGSLREEPEGVVFAYTRTNALEPTLAPDWLLERCVREESALTITVDGQVVERDCFEMGSNDAELTALAGFLRHRGLSGNGIATVLAGVIDSGILEQDESRPYTRDDAIRIARSASKWEPGSGDGSLAVSIQPDAWVCATGIDLVSAPIEWWLHGFIPRNELVMLYGDGGIGKSSWVSYIAALVTQAGGTFVHVGIEEPFRLFAARAVLLGAVRSRLFSIPNASSMKFPRDAAVLGEALADAKAGMLYFDSIYTHFEHQDSSNAAERARKALGPLAEIAQRHGVTIMGTFHENKAGAYLGSVEMQNVCRSFLHAERPEGKPLRVSVLKTNMTDPGHALEYAGIETDWVDPATGAVQMERIEDGSLAPMTLVLPGNPVKRAKGTVNADQLEAARETRASQSDEKAAEARLLLEEGNSREDIMRLLDISRTTLFRYLKG